MQKHTIDSSLSISLFITMFIYLNQFICGIIMYKSFKVIRLYISETFLRNSGAVVI